MVANVASEFSSDRQSQVETELDVDGYADLGPLLTRQEIDELRNMYSSEEAFRNRVVMRRHNFGEGEYKYFAYPLPEKITDLRENLYSLLAPICNSWEEKLKTNRRYPEQHAEFIEQCQRDGQSRPTPLILKYAAGDYNCLHQDLYGQHHFPLQVVIALSDAGDFDGGEFVVTEQRPRMQSRVQVVPLQRGHGVVFPVNERPKRGKRGYYRVKSRHGVSKIRRGERFTLGIIFHDAT